MPLRIKCRCGQEVVLRFSEWIYFLLGVLIFATLANACGLVLLYFRLGNSPPPRPAEPVKIEKMEELEKPSAQPAAEAPPAPQPPAPAAPPAEKNPPAAAPGVKREEPVASSAPAPSEGAAVGLAFRKVRGDDPPLLRFLLAEAAGGSGNGPSGMKPLAACRFLAALTLDPDPKVRRRAIVELERFLSSKKSPEKNGAAGLLEEARRWLGAGPLLSGVEAEGLKRLVGEPPLEKQEIDALPWQEVARQAELAGEALDGFKALQDDLAEKARRGFDILLAIDITESMEEPYQALKKRAAPLFSLIAWALPNSRLGLLFYRDEWVHLEGFGASLDQLVEAVQKQRAEGGGLPPEGVLPALKAALQLGRFTWRPEAQKQIVFIGDGSPPYEDKQALLGLARQVREEAGYRIHTIGLGSGEGKEPVWLFPELAQAGGGEAITTSPDRLDQAIFQVLFPRPAWPLAARALQGFFETN
ncbi:MAG: VWA domain-containing protein [Planctomycetes bacterium]|nr:VWA domain-containing protein [Planctomycetota bacterium]